MSHALAGLLLVIGGILIGIGACSFAFQAIFTGFYALILEGIGVALVTFVVGYHVPKVRLFKVLLAVILISIIAAAFGDPLLWRMQGSITMQNMHVLSIWANGVLGVIIAIFCVLGIVVRIKQSSQS